MKNMKNRFGHRAIDRYVETTYKKTASSTLKCALELGLTHALRKLSQDPEREILVSDFEVSETMFFPGKGSSLTPAHLLPDFKFTTYAPMAFRYIRTNDYLQSLFNQSLVQLSNAGANGSVFYVSSDDKFIIKTVEHKEAEFLQRLLPAYYMNLSQNKRTLLPKFYGLYCVQMGIRKIRFVVMNNLIPCGAQLHRKYDLKGSKYNRTASSKERTKAIPTYKDLDFLTDMPDGLLLAADKYSDLRETIKRDCLVLQSFEIMNYSLLIGVHSLGQAKKETEDEMGGMEARDAKGERLQVYVGIIDILQSYTMAKRLEHYYKAAIYDGNTVSVSKPSFYSDRFQKFMCNDVFKSITSKGPSSEKGHVGLCGGLTSTVNTPLPTYEVKDYYIPTPVPELKEHYMPTPVPVLKEYYTPTPVTMTTVAVSKQGVSQIEDKPMADASPKHWVEAEPVAVGAIPECWAEAKEGAVPAVVEVKHSKERLVPHVVEVELSSPVPAPTARSGQGVVQEEEHVPVAPSSPERWVEDVEEENEVSKRHQPSVRVKEMTSIVLSVKVKAMASIAPSVKVKEMANIAALMEMKYPTIPVREVPIAPGSGHCVRQADKRVAAAIPECSVEAVEKVKPSDMEMKWPETPTSPERWWEGVEENLKPSDVELKRSALAARPKRWWPDEPPVFNHDKPRTGPSDMELKWPSVMKIKKFFEQNDQAGPRERVMRVPQSPPTHPKIPGSYRSGVDEEEEAVDQQTQIFRCNDILNEGPSSKKGHVGLFAGLTSTVNTLIPSYEALKDYVISTPVPELKEHYMPTLVPALKEYYTPTPVAMTTVAVYRQGVSQMEDKHMADASPERWVEAMEGVVPAVIEVKLSKDGVVPHVVEVKRSSPVPAPTAAGSGRGVVLEEEHVPVEDLKEEKDDKPQTGPSDMELKWPSVMKIKKFFEQNQVGPRERVKRVPQSPPTHPKIPSSYRTGVDDEEEQEKEAVDQRTPSQRSICKLAKDTQDQMGGIIDILQSYTMAKKLERHYKAAIYVSKPIFFMCNDLFKFYYISTPVPELKEHYAGPHLAVSRQGVGQMDNKPMADASPERWVEAKERVVPVEEEKDDESRMGPSDMELMWPSVMIEKFFEQIVQAGPGERVMRVPQSPPSHHPKLPSCDRPGVDMEEAVVEEAEGEEEEEEEEEEEDYPVTDSPEPPVEAEPTEKPVAVGMKADTLLELDKDTDKAFQTVLKVGDMKDRPARSTTFSKTQLPICPNHAPPPPPPLPPSSIIQMQSLECPAAAGRCPTLTMKKLNWQQLHAVTDRDSMWLLSERDPPCMELDYNSIEQLFCLPATLPTTEYKAKGPIATAPIKEITLVELKKNLNLSIFLKNFKCSTDDFVAMIQNGDRSMFDVELLKQLLKHLPEKHKIENLKSFRGNKEKLACVDRFYYSLLKIPCYQLRVECMLLCEETSQVLKMIIPQAKLVSRAEVGALLKRLQDTAKKVASSVEDVVEQYATVIEESVQACRGLEERFSDIDRKRGELYLCEDAQQLSLEQQFCLAATLPVTEYKAKGPTAPAPIKEITFVELKKNLNLSIFLKHFKCSTDDFVAMIQNGERSMFDVEVLKQLLKHLPEKHKIENLKSFRGNKDTLAYVDHFYYSLLKIPCYQLRIECMLLCEETSQMLNMIIPQAKLVEDACLSLRESLLLPRFCRLILDVGNFLNYRSHIGNAVGFKISSLPKLADTKANKSQITLLHHILEEAELNHPELLALKDDMAICDEAAGINLKHSQAEVGALLKRLQNTAKEVASSVEDVVEQYTTVIEESLQACRSLEERFSEIDRKRKELAVYLCEDAQQLSLLELFGTIKTFRKLFIRALRENQSRTSVCSKVSSPNCYC